MNVKSKVALVFLGLVMGMVYAITVAAQEKPVDNMQIVVEKVRADKKLFIAENMQLNEAEAKAFWPVYEQYQDELFLLRARTAKLIKDYADGYEKPENFKQALERKPDDIKVVIQFSEIGWKVQKAGISPGGFSSLN